MRNRSFENELFFFSQFERGSISKFKKMKKKMEKEGRMRTKKCSDFIGVYNHIISYVIGSN